MPRSEVAKVLQVAATVGLLLLTAPSSPETASAQSGRATTIALNGNPVRGETLYEGCMSCHSIDKNGVGPKHRGVVGRHAGIIADYDYSEALKNSGLTWDEPTLDKWLANPDELVPGTKMFYDVPSSQDRADIIAYLKQQK
jgi:cytochrome c